MYLGRGQVDAPTLRYSVLPPEGWRLSLATRPGAPTPIVLAPNGRSLAFVLSHSEGPDMLWIQPLDALTPHPLAGTEGVSSVFWSPDSDYLGFFANNKLKKVSVGGGPPTTVCDAPGAAGGTWSRDGLIVFNGGVTNLKKVPAAGGTPTDATKLDPGEQAHFRPWLLPDGRHILYTGFTAGPQTQLPIYVGSLDSIERVRLGESSATNVMYSQGHLLFMRDSTLLAQPFDVSRLATAGEAFPIAEGIQIQGAEPHQGVFSVSTNGVLMYQAQGRAPTSALTWVTRAGKPLQSVGDAAAYTELSLSPDEKRAVVSIGMNDLWTIDLSRGLRTRFTFDQSTHASLLWSPNGDRIIFSKGSVGIFQKPSNGAGAEEKAIEGLNSVPTDVSPDGKYILYVSVPTDRADANIWVWITAERKAVPLLTTPFVETAARFSPDGKWVAYVSGESGRNEVDVVPFAPIGGAAATPSAAGGKWQISTNGGTLPRWGRNGREIFYYDEAGGSLMSTAVTGRGSALEFGSPQALFSIRPSGGIGLFAAIQRTFYDVSRDSQRFLVNAEPAASSAASTATTVVVNWLPQPRK